MNAVDLEIKGIKCDSCDYREPDVKIEDYSKWINRPCPKCGANLLTEADFKATMALIKTANVVNRLMKPFAPLLRKKFDGSGKIVFKKME